jgi:tetratricopeptide (TPR) repeat protein
MSDLTAITSELQTLVKSGAHTEGLSVYESLSNPTALEDRLGGQCLWSLGRYEEAKIPLYRALQRGELEAAVDLISIHVHTNDFIEAQEWIDSALTLGLPAKSQIKILFSQGDLYVKTGKNRQAIKTLKKAWVQANIIEEDKGLVSQVAQSLVAALQSVGSDHEALDYLGKALNKTNSFWETILKISQAYCAIGVGDYILAQQSLQQTQKSSEANLSVSSYHLIAEGIFRVSQKEFDVAARQFELAIQASERVDNREFQLLSRTWASASHLGMNDLDQARAVLMPLKQLELSPAEEAIRRLRLGVLHLTGAELQRAKIDLEAAALTFNTLEHQRELGWSLLRLAQWYLESGEEKLANETLERVADVANGVGGTAFLVSELNLMGLEVVQRLGAIASRYAMHALAPVLEPERNVSIPLDSRPLVRRLRVVTFGKPMLLAEDRNVTPRLNKAMELIAFLLINPQSSLERILDAVFPNSDLKAGANYFHQIRHKLTRDVPELRIVQDKQTKLYMLDSGTVPLESDYEDVVKLLNHATHTELHQALEMYRGAFMPHLESDWAEEVRNNVEWLLVRSGLRVVQDLYDRGNFEDCRKLTEKLRKVAPLDVGLNEMLVRATNEIDGLLAARRTLTDVEKYFNAEVGELPTPLENLKRDFKLNLN